MMSSSTLTALIPHPVVSSSEVTGTKRARLRVVVLASAVAGFAALIALLYVLSSHAFVATSDGATVVLEGQAMGAGHVMLHGWSLSLDSFWSVDALFYLVTELVTGVRPMLLNLVPSIIAAIVIVVGALMARDGRRGTPGVAAVVSVVALLALPSHSLAVFFLQGPLHVGTVLWCLIAFWGLRSQRIGRGWVVAVVFLAAGTLGDAQIIVLGIVPTFAAGVVTMLRRRAWRSGLPEVGAAAAALVLAAVLRQIADALGTFTVDSTHPRASLAQVWTNIGHLVPWGATMLGVGQGPLGNGTAPLALKLVHVCGLAAVVVGVLVASVALVRGASGGRSSSSTAATAAPAPWSLDDLLVLAFFADLGVFVVVTSTNDPGYLRYLTGAVIFGSILAGRWVGRLTATITSVALRRGAAVFGVCVVAAFAASSGFAITGARPVQPAVALGQFLETHQLRHGIGDYWSASITTVSTAGAVTIRPVITTPKGRVVRYERQSARSWYTHQSFEFLVFNKAEPWGGVDATTAAATFGPVARTYVVGPYRVLTWPHPLEVSAQGFAPVPVKAPVHAR
jgi:hypothetical protein